MRYLVLNQPCRTKVLKIPQISEMPAAAERRERDLETEKDLIKGTEIENVNTEKERKGSVLPKELRMDGAREKNRTKTRTKNTAI